MSTGEIELHVQTPARHYVCRPVGGDADALAEVLLGQVGERPVAVVVDAAVMASHGLALEPALRSRLRVTSWSEVAGGEATKQWSVTGDLLDAWLDIPATRDLVVIAIGGGATGDSVGFAAGILLRGVSVIQVPTTLLAMADASLGGKTGINTRQGKNLVGAFHHPMAVFPWVYALRSLDTRTLRSGLAEVIKCALLEGESSLEALEHDLDALVQGDTAALQRAVGLACQVKARIVEQDPEERGLRKLLNLGHTLGHAVEHALGYGQVWHGEAISMGLVAALEFSSMLAPTPTALVERTRRWLQALGLPTELPVLSREEWRAGLAGDKKRVGDSIDFVVAVACGQCEVRRVALEALEQWLEESGKVWPRTSGPAFVG